MKRLAKLSLFALLATAPTAAWSEPEGAGSTALDPVLQAFEAKDYQSALKQARPLVEKYEARYRGEKRTVYCAMNPHDREVLKSEGPKDAVIASDDWCMAMYVAAFSQTEVGDKAGAVATLERLTALSPLRAQFTIELGYAYRMAGKLDQAVGAYERGFRLADFEETKAGTNRLRGAALRGRGYVLIDKGDWDGAEKAYRDSLTYDPDSEVAQSELDYIKKTRPPTI